MNTATHDFDVKPWYRQFWPWFLISVPAITVIACMVTIYIALSRPHQMVVSDYTKMESINAKKFAAISEARTQVLSGESVIDRQTGLIRITLRRQDRLAMGEGTLSLLLSHPAVPGDDATVVLAEVDAGVYRGQLAKNITGRWYLTLTGPDTASSWRLSGELQAAADTAWLLPE